MNEQKLQQLGQLLQLMTGAQQAFAPNYEGQKIDLARQRAGLEQQGFEAQLQQQQADQEYRDWQMSQDNPQNAAALAEIQRMQAIQPLMIPQQQLENLGAGANLATGMLADGSVFAPDLSMAAPQDRIRRQAELRQRIFDMTGLSQHLFNPLQQFQQDFNNRPQ